LDLLDRDVDLSESDLSLIDRALSSQRRQRHERAVGPAAMTRVADALGVAGTSTPDDPSRWGETQVSPAGNQLYLHSAGVLHTGGRDYVVLMSLQPRQRHRPGRCHSRSLGNARSSTARPVRSPC
jgi:hypothetical protein